LRRYAEGIPELQEAAALSGDGPAFVGSLGYAYAVSGRTAEARRIAETLAERSRQTYVPPATVAVVFAGLGDRDAAFEWLEKAWDQHDPWITALKVEFMLDPLHSDPRFAALVKRVGLD
jgi:Flp pilus assembly protein TadD